MSDYDRSDVPPVSGWAVGGITFAATMLVLIGIFQALSGLVAIFDDNFYVVTRNYRLASTASDEGGTTATDSDIITRSRPFAFAW